MTTAKHALQSLLENAEIGTMPYSGRAMYGKLCLATTEAGVLSKLVEACLYQGSDLSDSEKDEIVSAMRQVRTDSLGHDTVTYFPSVEFFEEEEEDEEGEFAGEDPHAVSRYLGHLKLPKY